MNSKDILFINPLGWDNIIWEKVVSDEYFKNKNLQFISFLGGEYNKDKDSIFLELERNINLLSFNSTIVAASYGVKILLMYLRYKYAEKKLNLNLLLIDGLEIVPNKNILQEILLNNPKKEEYKTMESYFEENLDENEINKEFYIELMKTNIKINKSNYYELITKNKDLYEYLLYVEEEDNVKNLVDIVSNVKMISIFDTIQISNEKLLSKINYNLVENNQLMMLENEQIIISEIKKLDNQK